MGDCGHLVLHVHRHNPLDRACLHQYLGDHALGSELWQSGDNLVLAQMYEFQGEGGELCMVYQGFCIKVSEVASISEGYAHCSLSGNH